MAEDITVGSQEYFEKALKKKSKSQTINFKGKLWKTLDQYPNIGDKYFLDESLYNSSKIIATQEIGVGMEEQNILDRENRIIELYEEKGGKIEFFDIANYQVPASLNQIYEASFKNRQYEIRVNIVALKYKIFFFGLFTIPYRTTQNFITKSTTYPLYTENYERIAGQLHEGSLNIDTRLILRRNGRFYPKAWAIGNGFSTNGIGQNIGSIPFLGGSLPILVFSPDPNLQFQAGFGNISKIGESRENWSLTKEIESFDNGDVEEESLSQLAKEAISFKK